MDLHPGLQLTRADLSKASDKVCEMQYRHYTSINGLTVSVSIYPRVLNQTPQARRQGKHLIEESCRNLHVSYLAFYQYLISFKSVLSRETPFLDCFWKALLM